jgi:hypothetical protein
MISDEVHPLTTHCGWKIGAATARIELAVEVYDSTKKRCNIDLAQFAPTPPYNTRTTRIDVTAINSLDRAQDSAPSNHRYVRVTSTATTLRYDVIQSTACTKTLPITCFPF